MRVSLMRQKSGEVARQDDLAGQLQKYSDRYQESSARLAMQRGLTAHHMVNTAYLDQLREALAGGSPFLNHLLARDVAFYHAAGDMIIQDADRPW